MIVRLHNLSARAPLMADLAAVSELLAECEKAEHERTDLTEEDICKTWNTPGFNLKTDAWVIVTRQGAIVGYADVHCNEHEQFTMLVRVHPDYRGRGIGTLFVWLVEERARQFMGHIHPDLRVTLSTTVSSVNQSACELFEREGYTLARHFWRVRIEMDEMAEVAGGTALAGQRGRLRVDLVVDEQSQVGTMQLQQRAGLYQARQYDVYEKVLLVGKELQLEECEELTLSGCK